MQPDELLPFKILIGEKSRQSNANWNCRAVSLTSFEYHLEFASIVPRSLESNFRSALAAQRMHNQKHAI